MILTKKEITDSEQKLWNEIAEKFDKSPVNADGDPTCLIKLKYDNLTIPDTSYERLVALFVGSYYVNTLDGEMPRVKDADLMKTRDSLGEYFYFYKHSNIWVKQYTINLFSKGT